MYRYKKVQEYSVFDGKTRQGLPWSLEFDELELSVGQEPMTTLARAIWIRCTCMHVHAVLCSVYKQRSAKIFGLKACDPTSEAAMVRAVRVIS